MFGEERANLNDQYPYPVQFSRLICRRRKRNKTGVLHQLFAIFFTKSIFEESFSHLNNLINLELCLVRYEPISMTNTFIRCSSPGLFAGGVKEIRWVYCAGSYQYIIQLPFHHFFKKLSLKFFKYAALKRMEIVNL